MEDSKKMKLGDFLKELKSFSEKKSEEFLIKGKNHQASFHAGAACAYNEIGEFLKTVHY